MREGGLWNDKPALAWLKTQMADIKPTQRWIDVGLTDILKGTYVDYKQEDLTGDDLYNVMFAQFADPGVFAPVEIGNTDYLDGSSVWDLDIFSVVGQCKALGYAESDIVIDAIMTSEKTLEEVDASSWTSISMMWRYLKISRYYSNKDGYTRAKLAYPNAYFRYSVAPSAPMPGSSIYPLNLKIEEVDQIWSLGVADGENAVMGL